MDGLYSVVVLWYYSKYVLGGSVQEVSGRVGVVVRWSVDGGGGLPSGGNVTNNCDSTATECSSSSDPEKFHPPKTLALGSSAFSVDAPLCRSKSLALRYLSHLLWLKEAEAGESAKKCE